MREFVSTVTVTFDFNNLEAESKEQYIELIKEQFKDQYDIRVYDSEITNIEEVN